jgi:hypothetical protein
MPFSIRRAKPCLSAQVATAGARGYASLIVHAFVQMPARYVHHALVGCNYASIRFVSQSSNGLVVKDARSQHQSGD